mgnify:CR=1 FL=1
MRPMHPTFKSLSGFSYCTCCPVMLECIFIIISKRTLLCLHIVCPHNIDQKKYNMQNIAKKYIKINKLKKNKLIKNFRNLVKIYIKCTYSNIFISLINKKNKLITCCSSGSREWEIINVVKEHHKQLKKLCIKYIHFYYFIFLITIIKFGFSSFL